MEKPPVRLAGSSGYLLLLALCLGLSLPLYATAPDEDDPAIAHRSRTPMMDVLVLELMKGEPINSHQVQQILGDEFGKVWRNQIPEPVDPADSEEVRKAKFHAGTYLVAVKASLLDIDQQGGWPTGYGNLREFAPLMLEDLKRRALAANSKFERTILNYAIIAPAVLLDDQEALDRSDEQRNADWPADSYIARKAAALKRRAMSMFDKE